MSDVILTLRSIEKRFGHTVTAAGLSLELQRGEFFTLLGPSGSGKSTILRIIAGLEVPDAGRIEVEGRDITDLPPWRRGLSMVFQQYANFPHMNVADNIAYGLRRQSLSEREAGRRVAELLRLVGLAGFEERRVTQLSGGEQQRVAIARALAPRPKLLLLDEPLSALDEKIRREMQDELRSIQQTTGTTFVYVTHDQEEALTMSDRIAVLNHGSCIQCDVPERIFRRPRTPFVAHFFRGCNVLTAEVSRSREGPVLRLAERTIVLPSADDVRTGTRTVAVRGEDVSIGGAAGTCDLILPGVLEQATYRGVYTDYALRLPDGQCISAMLGQDLRLEPGSEVAVGLLASDIVLLEEDQDPVQA